MFAPAISEVMAEFHSDNEALASFVVSVYVLGFAFGPLFLAPMSELYGRWILYMACTALFFILTIACAVSSSLNMLIGFHFLAGTAGGASIAIGGGSIADLFPQEERGLAISPYTLGPVLAPAIGPVIGGFLSQAKGWRWIFWLITIIVSWVLFDSEMKPALTMSVRMVPFFYSQLSSCPKHTPSQSFQRRPSG
jgi:multidrug resistance protein